LTPERKGGSTPGLPEERYSRHLLLPGFGSRAQEKVRRASVAVVGAGGLGSPASLYLAAAGVGRLGLFDPERVELSNLQRQILYGTADLDCLKVRVAASRLRDLNPEVKVEAHVLRVGPREAEELFREYDLVIDAVDGAETRYVLNDAALSAGKPLVEGAMVGYRGFLMTVVPGKGPCLRCVFPQPPEEAPACAIEGVLGPLGGIMGALEALEALKLITGIGQPYVGRLLTFDAETGLFRTVRWPKGRDCPAHSLSPAPSVPAT